MFYTERVTTALLLAAGTGSRLYPLTKSEPKCLTRVNGKPILDRMISCLNEYGFSRLIIVTGHLEDCIRKYLGNRVGNVRIEYIYSPSYKTTNNIYSLWLARKAVREPFLLLESDLVFDHSLLKGMVYPDRIAVARMKPWMNGTRVAINQSQRIKAMYTGNKKSYDKDEYKTVNMYSFSMKSWKGIEQRLDRYIAEGKVKEYYEKVFADMVAEGKLTFDAVFFDQKPWYEIDTLEDLMKAEQLFSSHRRVLA